MACLIEEKEFGNDRMPNVSKKVKLSEAALPVIRCFCGAEILLLPDVKLMSKAIEAHVEEHIKNIKNAKKAEEEAERVRDDLITKVFDKACET
ncbi:MAG: hypothetical protein ACQCN6_08415 [Candidatus Bathyarchaeia archaeon]|jgi:hypothetical protein